MSLWCCGRAIEGALGLKVDQDFILEPKELTVPGVNVDNIRMISAGTYHTAMLTRDGLVYTFGRKALLGREGDIGPRMVASLEVYTVKSVSCGEEHTCCVISNGTIFLWGSNSHGQCGQPPPRDVPKPNPLINIPGIKVMSVVCGSRHTLALSTEGVVLSWGDNSVGQLGHSTFNKLCYTPTKVTTLDGVPVIQVAAGDKHNAALAVSGSLFMWGANAFGQLGFGDVKPRPVPMLVKGLVNLNVASVSCGNHHTGVLTRHGGVFTWGDGTYGQLGHNNTSNQLVPRKVFELMGITISVVVCGGDHTVAVSNHDSSRVWGFGSCSMGQIGQARALHHVLTPSQFTINREAQKKINSDVIQNVFAGQHTTFIKMSEAGRAPISTNRHCDLSEDKLSSHLNDLAELGDPTQLVTYLSSLFGSVSCINSLFLSTQHTQLSINSGIEMLRLRKVMTQLRAVKNSDYHAQMSKLTEKVVQSLPEEVPDIIGPFHPENLVKMKVYNMTFTKLRRIITLEQLRVFCVLPELPTLFYPTDYTPILANSLLKLAEDPLNVLIGWWSQYEASYFENLIVCFKRSVYRSLVNRFHNQTDNTERLYKIESCLKVLALLNDLNQQHELVPYNAFYIRELTDQLDLEEDYRNWTDKREVVFCKFPFVYTANAKAKLLAIDAQYQMVTMVHRLAVSQLIRKQQLSSPFLQLDVRRDHLVEDTLTQIRAYEQFPYLLKKPLKVTFVGEEGYDAGGVKKELFLLLLRELLSPCYGMFKMDEQSRFLWFCELNFECVSTYELIGILCGLAVYNSTIVDINFPPALYKKLLNMKITLRDFAKLHPAQADSLQQLLSYNEPDLEEVMSLNFTITRDRFGKIETEELVPNGSDIAVDQENKARYVEAYVDYYMNTSIGNQYQAFAKGFLAVAGGKVFEFFHPEELMHMVSGLKDFNFSELEQITEYGNGYSAGDPTIKLFWEVFHEMDMEMKKKFLIFLTGTDRIPIHGIHSLKLAIQKVKDNSRLPVAHTCFNLLDLPPYPNKTMLQDKLYLAIQNTEGFGLV